MKDYSEFIRDEYGFITSIKPNFETKTIEVYTSKSKKDRPHVYELNRENIKRLYKRLEKQWNLLIENKDSILKQLEAQREGKHKIVDGIGLGLSGILLLTTFFTSELFVLFILSSLPGIVAVTSTLISRNKFRKNFEDMIETYNYFITHKEEIEELAKTDENITRDITVYTYKELKKNNKLIEENITDEQYTIQLIDTLPLKDLKKMSLRYKISKALNSDPYFYEEKPEEIMGEPVIDEITEEEIDLAFDEEAKLTETNEIKRQNGPKKTLRK